MYADHTISPRSGHILRCIYASLGLLFPIFLVIHLPYGGLIGFWTASLGFVFTIVYGTTLPIITYQTRLAIAQRAATNGQQPPAGKFAHPVPPLCRLPAIAAASIIALTWGAALGLTLAQSVFGLIRSVDRAFYIAPIFGIVQAVFAAVQLALWLAVAGLAVRERRALAVLGIKRGVYQAPGALAPPSMNVGARDGQDSPSARQSTFADAAARQSTFSNAPARQSTFSNSPARQSTFADPGVRQSYADPFRTPPASQSQFRQSQVQYPQGYAPHSPQSRPQSSLPMAQAPYTRSLHQPHASTATAHSAQYPPSPSADQQQFQPAVLYAPTSTTPPQRT